jgi:integrase
MKVWVDGMVVKVTLKYDDKDLGKLKDIEGGTWDSKRRLWLFPLEKYEALQNLRDQFMREESLGTCDNFEREADKLVTHLKLNGYSPSTIKSYQGHLKRYLVHSQGDRSIGSIEKYLLYLIDVNKHSHAYCNQAVNAIKIYFMLEGASTNGLIVKIPRPKKEKKLPKVMSQQEVKTLLEATENLKHQTAFMMSYSCGMRVSEVANMRLQDIDSDRMVITIRQGKGAKDRIAPLSEKLLVQLRKYRGVSYNVPAVRDRSLPIFHIQHHNHRKSNPSEHSISNTGMSLTGVLDDVIRFLLFRV